MSHQQTDDQIGPVACICCEWEHSWVGEQPRGQRCDYCKAHQRSTIETVLMGNTIHCACGCGRKVEAGDVAYRRSDGGLLAPLYARKECVR